MTKLFPREEMNKTNKFYIYVAEARISFAIACVTMVDIVCAFVKAFIATCPFYNIFVLKKNVGKINQKDISRYVVFYTIQLHAKSASVSIFPFIIIIIFNIILQWSIESYITPKFEMLF